MQRLLRIVKTESSGAAQRHAAAEGGATTTGWEWAQPAQLEPVCPGAEKFSGVLSPSQIRELGELLVGGAEIKTLPKSMESDEPKLFVQELRDFFTELAEQVTEGVQRIGLGRTPDEVDRASVAPPLVPASLWKPSTAGLVE